MSKIANKRRLFFDFIFFVLAVFMASSALATTNLTPTYYGHEGVPKLYLQGYTGTRTQGHADILEPLFLNANHSLFFYGQAYYSHMHENWLVDPYSLNAGAGYRTIENGSAVYGFFFFGDYNRSANGNNFWDLSPGIERLGRTWDWHLNGYFPIGDKEWRQSGFASDFGDYQYVRLDDGHNRFDHIISFYEETGIGADAEIGRKLFTIDKVLVKAYAQGYYFHMQHNNNLTGVGGKISIQPTGYLNIDLEDVYDNYVHNVILVSARVSINDLINGKDHVDANDLQARLLDPVERDFAAAAEGSAVPVSGLPGEDDSKEPDDGGEQVEQANVWYFTNAYAHGGDGTKANPYGYDDFKQSTVTYVHNNPANPKYAAEFDFQQGGTYNMETTNPIFLYEGQTIFGRSTDYTQPVTGVLRPTLVGAFTLPATNSLNNIFLKSGNNFDTGINVLSGASNIVLNNVEIGVANSTTNAYTTGLKMANATVTVKGGSAIYGYAEGNATGIEGTGIEMQDGGSLTVQSSTVEGSATVTSANVNYSGTAYGIHGDGSGNAININGGIITGTAEGSQDYSGNGYGILIGEQGDNTKGKMPNIMNNAINITNNSQITGIGNGEESDANFSGNGYGVLIGYGYSGAYTTTIENNSITVNDSTVIGRSLQDNQLDDHSNNAHGVVIGFGNIAPVNNDLTIILKNNSIKLQNNAEVKGEVLGNSADADSYSGNGYGVLLGFGAVDMPGAGYTDKLDILNNTVSFSNAKAEGIGQTRTGNYSGYSYGVLLGYGYAEVGSVSDLELKGNNIDIDTSIIISKTQRNASGTGLSNSYGVLMGFGYNSGVAPNVANLYQNNLTVKNSSISTSLDPSNDAGNDAYGIKFGVSTDLGDFSEIDNNISITNPNITISGTNLAGAEDSWGVYVDNATGNVLQLPSGLGTITSTITAGASGKKISGPGYNVAW